jgi:hypothetical protein
MRSGILAALLVLLVALAAGCSSGSSARNFNFNGTWAWTGVITATNTPGVFVGTVGSDVAVIIQAGNAITVQFPGVVPFTGSCDTEAATFNVTGVGAVVWTMNGTADDDDTMRGELIAANGPLFIRTSYTLQLISRPARVGPAEGGAGAGSVAGMGAALTK